MGGGHYTMGGGHYTMGGGHYTMGGGHYTMDGGHYTMGGGHYTMGGGHYTMGGGGHCSYSFLCTYFSAQEWFHGMGWWMTASLSYSLHDNWRVTSTPRGRHCWR